MKTASPGAPRDYFEPDQWPHGACPPETPIEVLYAAELANFVRRLAWQRDSSLNKGLKQLAKDAGLGYSTLRYIAEGTRWTSLLALARLEKAGAGSAVGYNSVQARYVRGRTEIPATPPVSAALAASLRSTSANSSAERPRRAQAARGSAEKTG